MKTSGPIDDDDFTSIPVPEGGDACRVGWSAVAERLQRSITEGCSAKPMLIVESYPGVDSETIFQELQQRLKPALALRAAAAWHTPKQIEALGQSRLEESRTRLKHRPRLTLPQFFDAERLWHFRREIEDLREGLVVIVGCGASLIAWGQVLVYADLPRVEARSRLGRSDGANLGLENQALAGDQKLRIASCADWPMADRWKQPLIARWDFLLETSQADAPKLAEGDAVRRGFQLATERPFGFVPCRAINRPIASTAPDPNERAVVAVSGVSAAGSAWVEESLLLAFGVVRLELPALDLLLAQPRALLGETLYRRFGFDCPLPFPLSDLPDQLYAPLNTGEGWREEQAVSVARGGPVEMRRLHFTRGVRQHTGGRFIVLQLVEGVKASIESPSEVFAPLVFHYGQRFIVPAAIGEFVLRPAGLSAGRPCVMLLASMRMRP